MTRTLPALLMLTACSVGTSGPAPAGSPAATLAGEAAQIADHAQQVEQLAHALTSQVDESRRAVQEGRSTPEAEIPKIEALSKQVAHENDALQAEIEALEDRVRAAAGNAPQAEAAD